MQSRIARGRRNARAENARLYNNAMAASFDRATEVVQTISTALDNVQLDLDKVTEERDVSLAATHENLKRVQRNPSGSIIRVRNLTVQILARFNAFAANLYVKIKKAPAKEGAVEFTGIANFYAVKGSKAYLASRKRL